MKFEHCSNCNNWKNIQPCYFKFLVTKFIIGFIEFQKISTFRQTFGLRLHRPSAAEVEAKGEKPSTSAEDLQPSVDRWSARTRQLGRDMDGPSLAVEDYVGKIDGVSLATTDIN